MAKNFLSFLCMFNKKKDKKIKNHYLKNKIKIKKTLYIKNFFMGVYAHILKGPLQSLKDTANFFIYSTGNGLSVYRL